MGEEILPKFDYYLDESDPDVVVLRRQDGAFVAAFSARGVTTEGIVEAAKEDYRKLLLRLRARARPSGWSSPKSSVVSSKKRPPSSLHECHLLALVTFAATFP